MLCGPLTTVGTCKIAWGYITKTWSDVKSINKVCLQLKVREQACDSHMEEPQHYRIKIPLRQPLGFRGPFRFPKNESEN